MRNALSEIPVLLLCLWGGGVAGIAAALVRLPGRLYTLTRRGRRTGLFPKILFSVFDIAAAALAVSVFCLTLLRANGGEPRLFAVCAFIAGAAVPARAIRVLTE